jgi:hypothetical protein
MLLLRSKKMKDIIEEVGFSAQSTTFLLLGSRCYGSLQAAGG